MLMNIFWQSWEHKKKCGKSENILLNSWNVKKKMYLCSVKQKSLVKSGKVIPDVLESLSPKFLFLSGQGNFLPTQRAKNCPAQTKNESTG